MQPYIYTRIHPKLILMPEPTIRVWLYVVVSTSKSSPLVTTATDIAQRMERVRKTSVRSASQAIKDLEGLGLISVRRVGRAMEISLSTATDRAAA